VVVLWAIGGAAAITAAGLAAVRHGADSLLRRQPPQRRRAWEWLDRGPTPLGELGFTPQGLTWVNGRLIFANTWKDEKSRVYELDPETMRMGRTFDMPPEAVHTSGLAWDGQFLWAVDYRSNQAYQLDLERSFAEEKARVVGQFATSLRGTSACCFVPWNGRTCLAISDFMRTRRTILVRVEEALRKGTAAGCIEFSYRNEGLSQGLEYIDDCLYEAENKWGVDVVNQLSLDKLRETRSAFRSTIRQFAAPARGVEDLAWDGRTLWTSDESVFRFFQCRLLADPLENS
jgi:glutamine cyclotransferase